MKANYDLKYLDEINLTMYEEEKEKDYFVDKKLKIEKAEYAYVLPYKPDASTDGAKGGVADKNGKYIGLSAQRIVGREMNCGYEIDSFQKSDKTVIWLGTFHAHWGHFLNEMISRCWYFIKEKENRESMHIAYIRKSDSCQQQIEGNYLEFLNLLGIKKEQLIEVTEITQFRQVVIPELSNRAGEYYTKEYIDIFNAVRDNVSDAGEKHSHIYCTRLQSKNLKSTELGERRIKRLFEKNKYHVLAPEYYTLREQINYYKNCDEMVVVAGTLAHNVLFAKDGVNLTVVNRDRGVNTYQTLINQAKKVNITYIDANLSFFPVFAGGPFLLYMSDNLYAYAKSKGLRASYKKEGVIGLHMKLAWYFFCYLDSMTGEGIKHWKLDEKYGTYIMNTYAFYRQRIPKYDCKTVRKLRKCFYILARLFE